MAEAFEQTALALTAVITDPDKVRPLQAVEVTCEARDLELLLVEWLNRLVYEMSTRRMLFSRFVVQLQPAEAEPPGGSYSLRATAWGEPVDVARHQPAVEVKGATYSELEVAFDPSGVWLAQCVVDV